MRTLYDYATDKTQPGFDRKPEEVEECFFCEGSGVVLVAKVYDLDGKAVDLPFHALANEHKCVCPWCK